MNQVDASARVLELLCQTRLVVIIRLDDLGKAVQLSRALLEGGILVQEFTLSNPEALQALKDVKEALPAFRNGSASIGLGSVRNPLEAHKALEAGAQFIVTPTTHLEVIRICKDPSTTFGAGTCSKITSSR